MVLYVCVIWCKYMLAVYACVMLCAYIILLLRDFIFCDIFLSEGKETGK